MAGQVVCGCGMAGLCRGMTGLYRGMARLCRGMAGLCHGMVRLCHGMAGLRRGMTELCHGIAGLCHDMVRVVLWGDIVMALHGGQAERMGLGAGGQTGHCTWGQTDTKEHGLVKQSRLV